MADLSGILVARRPILDMRRRLVGYKLRFQAASADPLEAAAETGRRALRELASRAGWEGLVGRRFAFLDGPPDLLAQDVVESLPKAQVVFEIPVLDAVSPSFRMRCRQLRKQGFRLTLGDFEPGDEREALLREVDYVKLDPCAIHPQGLRLLLHNLRRFTPSLIAEGVETRDAFEWCRRLGFELVEGYCFAQSASRSGFAGDATRRVVFELVRRLREEDDLARIEQMLEQNPPLAARLLGLVNSVALARVERIDSIRRALVLLGDRQLERWLLMLLFAGCDASGASNLLLQTAAARGRLMERLVQQQEGEEAAKASGEADRAFAAGLLSLIDVLLDAPAAEVLERLHVEAEIRSAVLEGTGRLGALLTLAVRLERGDFEAVRSSLDLLGLRPEGLLFVQCDAYRWAEAADLAPAEEP